MQKIWRFRDTSATCPEYAPIRLWLAIGQVMLHFSAIYPYSTKAKNMVKSTVSVLFAFHCTNYLEPRWVAAISNCKQSHALSINNKVSVTSVQNVHCYASCTVVLNLLYVMQHSTFVKVHIRKRKHTKNSTISVLFQALCTLDLKLRGDDKWSNCVQIHALCTGSKIFLTQKFELSKMCTLNLVYCSVHETCTERLFLHYIVSPFVHHISLAVRKPKPP